LVQNSVTYFMDGHNSAEKRTLVAKCKSSLLMNTKTLKYIHCRRRCS